MIDMEYHYVPAEKWFYKKQEPMRWYIKYAWVFLELLVIAVALILIL
jgi:hypothetical protein